MGVVRGPREIDPKIRRATWVAWARGPNDERADGERDNPVEALGDLANKLEKLRPRSERLADT
jgi:hypothetical protein